MTWLTQEEIRRKRRAIRQVSRKLLERAKVGMFAEMKKDLAVSDVMVNGRTKMGDLGDWVRIADLFVFEKGTVWDVYSVGECNLFELCLTDGERTYRFSLRNVQGSILRSVKFYFDEERKRFWDSFVKKSFAFAVLKDRLELKDLCTWYLFTDPTREDVSFAPGHLFEFYPYPSSPRTYACDDQGRRYIFEVCDLLKAQYCMVLFEDEKSARAASAAWSQACNAKAA